MKVLHIINDLAVAGTEVALYNLVRSAPDVESFVLSLTSPGPIGERMQAAGIPTAAAYLPSPLAPVRIARALAAFRPDVVNTWLYHANVVGSLVTRAAQPAVPIVWGIRQSNLSSEVNSRAGMTSMWIGARLSRTLPAAIAYNSEAGHKAHAAIGYTARSCVIPNGIDTEHFRPSPANNQRLKAQLGIPADCVVIGNVGRLDPQKDYETLLAAAQRLAGAPVRFVLIGRGLDQLRPVENVHVLPEQSDIVRYMAAFDVYCSSSAGEGFSNAIAEAMACAVPVVATSAGDSATIIGETGIAVPAADPAALAAAIQAIIPMRSALGPAARRRICDNYSLSKCAAAYTQLYQDVIRQKQLRLAS